MDKRTPRSVGSRKRGQSLQETNGTKIPALMNVVWDQSLRYDWSYTTFIQLGMNLQIAAWVMLDLRSRSSNFPIVYFESSFASRSWIDKIIHYNYRCPSRRHPGDSLERRSLLVHSAFISRLCNYSYTTGRTEPYRKSAGVTNSIDHFGIYISGNSFGDSRCGVVWRRKLISISCQGSANKKKCTLKRFSVNKAYICYKASTIRLLSPAQSQIEAYSLGWK